MGRKKGKQSAGAGSKRGRAAQDRVRARNTRDDLKRLAPRSERPRTQQPSLSVRELLFALPRAPKRPRTTAAPAAIAPGLRAPAPTGTLLNACARVIGAHLDRYPPDAAAHVFSLLPGRALETIAAVAAERRLFDDALIGLVVAPDVARLAIGGNVTDAGLDQIVPSSAGAVAVSAWDSSAPVSQFHGCLRLRALALDAPLATSAFVRRLIAAAPDLEELTLAPLALSSPGQAPRAAADAIDALDGLRILDVRGCAWTDGPTLGRVLASRAAAPAIAVPCWGAGSDPFDDMETDELAPRARPQLKVLCDVDDLTRRRLQVRFRNSVRVVDSVRVVSARANAERASRAAQTNAVPRGHQRTEPPRLSRSLEATAATMRVPGHRNPGLTQPLRSGR